MNRSLKWVIFLIVLVSCILGCWGYYRIIPAATPPAPRFLDALYHTVRLYTVEFADPVTLGQWGLSQSYIPSWQLQVARFLAPVATLATLLGAFSLILQSQVKQWRLRLFYHGHDVVLGYGSLTRVLVEDLLGQKRRVVLVHEGVDSRYPPQLTRRRRLLTLEGSETRLALLEKANLADARHIFFTSEEDGNNLLAAILSYRLNQRGNDAGTGRDTFGVVQLTRQSLVEQLKSDRLLERLGSFFRLDVFDPYDRIARRLVRRILLAELAGPAPAGRPVLLYGMGKVGSRVLEQLLRQAYLPGLPRLRLTVIDSDPTTRAAFFDRFPVLDPDRRDIDETDRRRLDHLLETMGFPQVTFFDGSAQDFLRREERSAPGGEAEDREVAEVVSIGDGLENYALASHLSQIETPRAARVYFRLYQRATEVGGFLETLTAGQESGASKLEPFGMAEIEGRAQALLQPEIDRMARHLHAEYLRHVPDGTQTPATRPWEHLSEAFRDSNRAAADHLELKLAVLGHHELPAEPAALHALADMLDRELPGRHQAGKLEALAEAEHNRWMADKLLAGWLPGPERDDRRKRHPNLVPWDGGGGADGLFADIPALDDADREKDVRVLMQMPDYLRGLAGDE